MPMKTIEGYSKEKYTDTSVLLAGGGAKALSDFIGALAWDSTNKKITYTPVGGSATDLVIISWDNIKDKPSSFTPASHTHNYAGSPSAGGPANKLASTDKRSQYPATIIPNYSEAAMTFMQMSTLGISDHGYYADVLAMSSYMDSSGGRENAIIFAKNNTSVWHTQFNVKSDSSWGTPYLFADSNNSSVSGGGNSLGSSITVKICETEVTLTIPSTVDWSSLTGIPGSFTPSSHNHSAGDINSGTLAIARGGTNKSSWTQYGIVYASATDTLSQITNPSAANSTYWLKAVTNGSKVPTYSWSSITWDDVTGKPSTYSPSAHDHERILPTRHDSDAPTPSTKGKSLTFQFSYFDSDWWNVLNMRSYDDYRYLSAQLLTPAGNPGSDTGYGDMYWRQGRNSTWIAKRKICDDSNSSVSGGGNSLGSSITVKIAGTEKTLTIPSTVAWSSLTGVPSSFTPATHSHDSVHYLSPHYNSEEKPNPQEYFNENIGVKVAMTRYSKIGSDTDAWHDTLWINGYSGSDVPSMCALTFKRDGTPRFFVHSQSNRSTTYGTYYEVITGYNIASQSVNYATSAGSTTSATRTRYLTCPDTRSDAPAPGDYTASTTGVSFDFKASSVTGLSGYSGVMTVRPYASEQDWSGGPVHQIAFYSDGTLYHRTGTSSWGNWETLITSSNIGSQSVNYATSAGSASYADSAGSASSATTASKVANSLSWTNSSGSSQSFNGSSAVTINGIYTAYNATNATKADTVKTITKSDANSISYLTMVTSNNDTNATNPYGTLYTDDSLYYNPYTNTLSTGTISANTAEISAIKYSDSSFYSHHMLFYIGSVFKEVSQGDATSERGANTANSSIASVDLDRVGSGQYVVSIVNHLTNLLFIWPMLLTYGDEWTNGDSSYEHAWAQLYAIEDGLVTDGTSGAGTTVNATAKKHYINGKSGDYEYKIKFRIACGYSHAQGNWATNDFIKQCDDRVGFELHIFGTLGW